MTFNRALPALRRERRPTGVPAGDSGHSGSSQVSSTSQPAGVRPISRRVERSAEPERPAHDERRRLASSAEKFPAADGSVPCIDSARPMDVHSSREHYFRLLKSDPWGFETPHFDWSGEDRFVAVVGPAYLAAIAITVFLSFTGRISAVNPESYVYFAAATAFGFLGKLACSYAVRRWQVKINYVRKLGLRPWKKLTAFVIPFLVTEGAGSIPDTIILFSLVQLVTIGTEWHVIRRRSRLLRYAFLSWDRLEDRPYSMRYDLLEDVLRFMIYLPFMVIFGASSLIVLIPNLVNEFGDGLAEPVGIRFGRHPYRTRALWHGGKFWSGVYQRTWEGSATVFAVTILVLFFFMGHFTDVQMVLLFLLLPIGMTVAEAVSPHTADGPLIALVGCTALWCVQWV